MESGEAIVDLRNVPVPSQTYHVLPFKVEYDGPTESSKFVIEEAIEANKYETSFRGRRLYGRKIDLKNYVGVVVEPESHLDHENEPETRYATKAMFGSLINWEHGRMPEPVDPFGERLTEMISVAESIHLNHDS